MTILLIPLNIGSQKWKSPPPYVRDGSKVSKVPIYLSQKWCKIHSFVICLPLSRSLSWTTTLALVLMLTSATPSTPSVSTSRTSSTPGCTTRPSMSRCPCRKWLEEGCQRIWGKMSFWRLMEKWLICQTSRESSFWTLWGNFPPRPGVGRIFVWWAQDELV